MYIIESLNAPHDRSLDMDHDMRLDRLRNRRLSAMASRAGIPDKVDAISDRTDSVRADLESRIVASAAQLRATNAELQKQIRARERLAGRLLTLQDEER